MGNVNWGKVFKGLLVEVIKFFLPKAKVVIEQALEWAIEWAYNSANDWASKLEEKPSSTEKMAKAVNMVKVIIPEVEEPAVRMLLEAKHLEVTGKAVV